jgi:hypothetical protein
MNRYAVRVGFALFGMWIALIFVLVSGPGR